MKIRGFEVAIKTKNEKGEAVKWDAKLPVRATKNAAGYDFYLAEDVDVPSIWGSVFNRMFIKKDVETEKAYKVFVRRIVDAKSDEELETKKKSVKEKFAPIMCHTGVKAYMQEDEVLYLYNRSSNPKKLGLILANSTGVVDADYYGNESNDGEIMFAFYNIFPFTLHLKKGDKIGQGVFQKFLITDGDTAEGDRTGGFGSTDKTTETTETKTE